MTKRLSPLTSSDSVTRQARRLARQQKKLENELTLTEAQSTRVKAIRFENLRELEPLTDNQANFFEAYENDDADAYCLYGSAGTGKSFMALYFALRDILSGRTPYKRVVIIRTTVPVRDQGFLPGEIEDKHEPYFAPYRDICANLLDRKDAFDKLKDIDAIECVSTSFMRGITLDRSIVIFDECQNATWEELNTVCTRIGKHTKLICCGDSLQTDLVKTKNDVSGFRDFLAVTNNMTEFRHFRFTSDDIVRSGFVKSWIKACEKIGIC